MMDNNMMKIINVANGTQHIEATTVLFEFAGESQAAGNGHVQVLAVVTLPCLTL
jgi:hypothetical protein